MMSNKNTHDTRSYHRTQMQRNMILQRLKEKGCRITKQRLLLLDIILEQECSSCKEIYYKAVRQDRTIGSATVYRMVNTMEEIGAVSRRNVYTVACTREGGCHAVDYGEIIACIAGALEARDSYWEGHSRRVGDIALLVCRRMKLSPPEAERIHVAAHLHDIGKISISDNILNKEGALTREEWAQIKCHPQTGAGILDNSPQLGELKELVLHHHERYDGKGYPHGLKGEEIPLGARIIAVCDSIDAMCSKRSYRKKLSPGDCRREIVSNSGTMYDPDIVTIVLENWEEIIKMSGNQRKNGV